MPNFQSLQVTLYGLAFWITKKLLEHGRFANKSVLFGRALMPLVMQGHAAPSFGEKGLNQYRHASAPGSINSHPSPIFLTLGPFANRVGDFSSINPVIYNFGLHLNADTGASVRKRSTARRRMTFACVERCCCCCCCCCCRLHALNRGQLRKASSEGSEQG